MGVRERGRLGLSCSENKITKNPRRSVDDETALRTTANVANYSGRFQPRLTMSPRHGVRFPCIRWNRTRCTIRLTSPASTLAGIMSVLICCLDFPAKLVQSLSPPSSPLLRFLPNHATLSQFFVISAKLLIPHYLLSMEWWLMLGLRPPQVLLSCWAMPARDRTSSSTLRGKVVSTAQKKRLATDCALDSTVLNTFLVVYIRKIASTPWYKYESPGTRFQPSSIS